MVVISAQDHILASSVGVHASDLNPGSVTFVGKREPGIWL